MLQLSLIIDASEGALVRLLGTIERRGFRLDQLSSRPHAQGLEVQVQIDGKGRPADVLLRQVRRLFDVREATLDVARPSFSYAFDSANEPCARELIGDFLPQPSAAGDSRRRMSFLGIPDRVSNDGRRDNSIYDHQAVAV